MNLARFYALTAALVISVGLLTSCSSTVEEKSPQPTPTPAYPGSTLPEGDTTDEPEAPEDRGVSDEKLEKLDPKVYDEMISALSKTSNADQPQEGESENTIRINEKGARDAKGRYIVTFSSQVPVFCYSDTKEKVSFKVTSETSVMLELAPVEDCDYEFNEKLQMELAVDDAGEPNVVTPKELDPKLKPLFESFSSALVKMV